MSNPETWALIHGERASVADTLAGLSPDQWAEPSLCTGWSVHDTAGHILLGAEQTPGRFMKGMAVNGLRFDAMMDRDARKAGQLPPTEIVDRLRATVSTTNHPPGPVTTMLGEVVVHGEEIRRALGLPGHAEPEAVARCLDMLSGTNFPVGGKRRIAGLRLAASDVGWSHGSGPEVSGPGLSLLLAITGRHAGLDDLAGEGVPELRDRMAAAT